jgi:phospholipid/cholesterol/gamma-HCH transport system ATP-binding protein
MSTEATNETSAAGECARMQDAVIGAADQDRRLEVADWRLQRGEFWVVGGLNWSGKTEWLMTAAGLQPLAAGRQWLLGEDLAELTTPERMALRRRIGFVFEHTARPFTELNVIENLILPVRYDSQTEPEALEERLDAILDLCELQAVANQFPSELSRGMQRRTGLARALMMEPELLFIDSPLVGLDPVHARWWMNVLHRFHSGETFSFATPRTIVVTVEDFRPWVQPDRKFALLNAGKLQIIGGPERVRTSQQRIVQEMFAGDVPE